MSFHIVFPENMDMRQTLNPISNMTAFQAVIQQI